MAKHKFASISLTMRDRAISSKFSTHTVFALERDFASLYTLWGELSQNELTNASVLSLPGKTLKTDERSIPYYRKRRCTYFLIEMFEKSMKSSLFYFIYPANSNSRENSGILARFPCFLLIFKLVFCL